MPGTASVRGCVNSPRRGSKDPPPSRCFLKKGSCAPKWLFPDVSCRPGARRRRQERPLSSLVTVMYVGALSSGNAFRKSSAGTKSEHSLPTASPPDLITIFPGLLWVRPYPCSYLRKCWLTGTDGPLVQPPSPWRPEMATLAQGHMKRASRDLNSEPLTHRASDGLPGPSLVSLGWQHSRRAGHLPGFSGLPPSRHPARSLRVASAKPTPV